MSTTSVREGGGPRGQTGQTLVRFVMSELREGAQGVNPANPRAGAEPSLDLVELVAAIQAAVKAVSAALRAAVPGKWHGARDMASDFFIGYLRSSTTTSLVVCDQREMTVEADGDRCGKYVVCVSPLDVNEDADDPPPVAGSVFGVYRYLQGRGHTSRSALQAGRNLVAAGYAVYGSNTVLVLSLGQGVHLFVLDPILGELILTTPNITIPTRGRTYSVDEGLTYEWADPVVEYIESKKDPKLGVPYRSHHVGSVVADVHSILRNGGIYLSPQTRSSPNGKLRLVLEAAPLAHIVCRAGGLATDGHSSLLDCLPDCAAHRSAVFLGSREDVRDLLAAFRRHGLHSTRPSALRAAFCVPVSPIHPSPSLDTGTQPRDREQKAASARERAMAGLSASVAALSASVAALGVSTPSRLGATTPSRPTSAASASYPAPAHAASAAVLSAQTPQASRPVTAGITSSVVAVAPGPLRPIISPMPHSLAARKLS